MNYNNVDIDIATDYTAFTNTVTFTLTVPIGEADATTIYKSMLDGKWSDTETAINTAISNSAPAQVKTLTTTLMNAYTGTDSTTVPSGDKPVVNTKDDAVEDTNDETGDEAGQGPV